MARADISASVNKYIPKLNNGDWKIRKEGIDAIELLLTQNNNKIKLDGLYDFISVLKSKINDPNKTLVKIFITFAGRFVEACGKDIKNHCKPILLFNISREHFFVGILEKTIFFFIRYGLLFSNLTCKKKNTKFK